MIGDEGREEMPLDQAIRIAEGVKHRNGGTDKALARLLKEAQRLERIRLEVVEITNDYNELEAELPDKLWRNINGNRDMTARAIRLAVTVSKRTLREKIAASFAEGQA